LPAGSKDRGGCTPSGNSGYWPDTRSEPDAINSRPASLLCTGSGELIPDSAGRHAAAESTILGLDPIVLRGRRQRDGLPVIYSYQRSAEGVAVRLSGTAKAFWQGLRGPGRRAATRAPGFRDGSLLYTGKIKLNAGDRVELSRLIPPARKLELRLEGGVFVPLSGAARASLPVSPAAALRLRTRNWPAPLLAAELSISMFGSTGATATYAEPYDLLGVHLQVGLGRMFDLGRTVYLQPQFQLGNLWLSRNFRQFTGSDSLRAFTFTPGSNSGLRHPTLFA
jgi:hypothetical protein